MTGITDWTKQKVLVIGGGPIGFALVIALRAYQPEKILVSEPTAERRKQISDFVDISLDPTKESVIDKCHQMTRGEGIDIVFDCAGVPAGLSDGLNALKCEGTYMNLAMWDKPVCEDEVAHLIIRL
jgi:(R,R)-butanediol dehydrogenase/meso-butanediol dehydrogenase/diacetyl reductase